MAEEDFGEEEPQEESEIQGPRCSSFIDLSNYSKIMHKGQITLKMLLLTSDERSKEEILNLFQSYFKLKQTNDIYILKKNQSEKDDSTIYFYGYLWFFPDEKRFAIFTFYSKENIRRNIITPFLSKSRHIFRLWINQQLVEKFLNYLRQKYEAIFTSWNGRYVPNLHKRSSIRPSIKRRISYSGNDSWDAYAELQPYGCNLERFSVQNSFGLFKFNRKEAMLSIKYGNLQEIVNIADYIYDNAEIYLEKIRQFQKTLYQSNIFNRSLCKVSNDLAITFKDDLSNEILSEIVKELKNSKDLKVSEVISNTSTDSHSYRLKIFNLNTKGSFRVIISPQSVHIYQIFNANFVGAIPIIDIIDFSQPQNSIMILG